MRSAVLFGLIIATGLVAAVPRVKRQLGVPGAPGAPAVPARPTAPPVDDDLKAGIAAAFGAAADAADAILANSAAARFINTLPANSVILRALKGEADINNIPEEQFKNIPGIVLTQLVDAEFEKIETAQIVAWLKNAKNGFNFEQLELLSTRVSTDTFEQVMGLMKDAAESGGPDARPNPGISADVQDFLVRKFVEANVNDTCAEMAQKLQAISFMPQGMTPENLDRLRENSDQNCPGVAEAILEINGRGGRYCRMSAEAREEVCDFARSAAGDQKDTVDNLAKLGPFTDCLTSQDLERASADTLIDLYEAGFFLNVDELPEGGSDIIRRKLDASYRMPKGQDLIDFFNGNLTLVAMLGPVAETIGDMIGDLSQLDLPTMRRMKQTISSSRVCQDGETQASMRGPSKEERELDRQLLALEMADPSSVTAATLNSLVGSLAEMQPSEIENLNADAVVGAIETLADEDFSWAEARTVIDKFKSGSSVSGAFSAAQVTSLGKLVAKLPLDELDQMDDADVRSAISTFASAKSDMSPAQAKKIAKKARNGNLLDQLGNGEIDAFVDALPLKEFKDIETEIAADIANGDYSKYSSLQLSGAQATYLYEKMASTLSGELDRDTVISMGNAIAGAGEDVLDLIPNDNFAEVIGAMSDQADFGAAMNRKMAKRLETEIISAFDQMSQTDLDTIPADVMPDVSTESLDAVPAGLCGAVAQKVAGSDRLFNTQGIRQQKHARNALRCLGKETSGDLGEADMATLGNLICGAEDAVLDRVDASGAKTALENLQNCPPKCLTEDKKTKIQELFGKMTANAQASQIDTDSLAAIGKNAFCLPDATLSGIPNDVVSNVRTSLVDGVDMAEEEALTEQDSSCGIDRAALLAKVKEAEAGSASSRRKRQTTVYTCADVQDLGNAAVSLTEAELGAMTAAEFANCVETLGGLTGWSAGQLEVMRDKVFSDVAAAGSLTTDQILTLGKIATAFTTSHLSALDLSDIDAVYSIAQHSGYSAAQTEAAFTKYLGSGAVSAITSEHLVGLSNFLGGMTTAQIGQIDNAAFQDAAANIGTLAGLSSDQLTALKNKAVSASGAVSSWSAADLAEFGTVAAGLETAELSALTNAQVPEVSPAAIPLYPTSTFCSGFSVDQLNLFTMEQAQAVTNEQYFACSAAQQGAIDLAQYGADDVNDAPNRSSGVGAVHACVMLVFSAVLVRLL
ncbi:PREDICTED: otoancorin-like [Branchiostoma belcheri]|uniref:Otoancorin-like n=1 Tax=Branchiostoma belcheri TaxID=7741 RepID=A0A6P4ZUB4_BRABE|nr:PREDICTED: otoancorin-like [Branchiostoma belcheri]